MNSKDLAIGVLSTTAVVLFVGLVLINNQPVAHASGMSDSGGDYILISGALWAQEELLYVVNTAENKMLCYRLDRNTNQIVPVGATNLAEQFSGAAAPPQGRPGRKKP